MAPPASGAHGMCPACHTLDTPLHDVRAPQFHSSQILSDHSSQPICVGMCNSMFQFISVGDIVIICLLKNVNFTCNRLCRPLGLCDVVAPTFYR
jgi:hypothetical protein